jgi:hypothetical protein
MSDRAILFLFSTIMIVAALGISGWLFASGEVRQMDGLFLLTACLVALAAFGLYLRFLYRRAAESLEPRAAKSAAAQAHHTGRPETTSTRSESRA